MTTKRCKSFQVMQIAKYCSDEESSRSRLSLTLPGLAPTPGQISGPADEASYWEAIPQAGGPGKEAAQRQGIPG
eukprot:3175723-Pyramimonas_sp.AAC.1